jgi:cytoskeletal protein CcmA (bactofilin family)
VPSAALAEVRHEGDWSDDPEISLDLDNVPRAEALRRLADEAGWNLVINAPKGDLVSLHVEDQPASKLLDVLLADGQYTARRDDRLISITPLAAGAATPSAPVPAVPAVPPVPAVPAVPPVPPIPAMGHDGGQDRLITGGDLRIGPDEVVHNVTVLGGNLEVLGTVTGNLSVMGGNARIRRGAHVRGDAATAGGALTVESGASIDGDVGVMGGSLKREDGAHIGGEVRDGIEKVKRHVREHRASKSERAASIRASSSGDEGTKSSSSSASSSSETTQASLASRAASAVNAAALLFVFGAVLLALAPDRMEKLKVQIASHPMRTFATGVVGVLGGVLLMVAACLTVIGIPFVILGILAAVFGTLAALCSVLETVGAGLLGHRTKNPYVHLAFGGLLFLVVGAIPFVGGFIRLAVILTAFGSLVATRAAGFVPAKLRGSPYRANVPADAV